MYSRQKILNQIESLADGDRPPSAKEFREHSETASLSPVERLFDNWNNAVEAAGYSTQKREYDRQKLLPALQQAVDTENIDQIRTAGVDSGEYPAHNTYRNQFGSLSVAAMRGRIDVDLAQRTRAVPLTRPELGQFIEAVPNASPQDQAVSMIALLTGCASSGHKWVAEEGIEKTETDSVILYPPESKRGSRSVSIGPLHNQIVKMFEVITPERLAHSIEFSNYPPSKKGAANTLRRVSRSIDFGVNRAVVGAMQATTGSRVLHRDLRCTHYLFERVRGASQAMLKRRLALSEYEVKHYNRFLDDDEQSWSVRIEWRD